MKKAVIIFLILCFIASFAFIFFQYGDVMYDFASSPFEKIGKPSNSLRFIDSIRYTVLVLLEKENLITPANTTNIDVKIDILMGESIDSVCEKLKKIGLVNDSSAFRNYLVYSGIDTQIKAGEYSLNSNMTPVEIAWTLQKLGSDFVDFAILAGWRVEEIAVNIPNSGFDFSSQDMVNYVNNFDLEGYLFPGIYTFPKDIPMESMVSEFVNSFNSVISTDIKKGFIQQDLTIQEAVILASIVEREAVVDDEMGLIASVFINRLRNGMGLKADPTVQYAIGYNEKQKTWWTNPLTSSDLEIDSPFNTYIYQGLPPSPICNPGLTALTAVAFPAETSYYYFRAACDDSGKHLFTSTYEQHLSNACP